LTTLTAFVTALGDLTVTGVLHAYDEPPTSLNDADLPALWVQLPQSDEAALTLDGVGGWPVLRAQLIIAYQPTAQGTQAANWSGTLAILDALADALHNTVSGTLGRGKVSWSLKPGQVSVAGIDYWAVIADVVGNG
jgi:hypothetical protein